MFESTLGYISKTKLFGLIPLDILSHLIAGIIIYLIVKRISKKSFVALLIIFIISLLKEYWDSFRLNSTMNEHIKDILVTLSYPLLSFVIEKIRKISRSVESDR